MSEAAVSYAGATPDSSRPPGATAYVRPDSDPTKPVAASLSGDRRSLEIHLRGGATLVLPLAYVLHSTALYSAGTRAHRALAALIDSTSESTFAEAIESRDALLRVLDTVVKDATL